MSDEVNPDFIKNLLGQDITNKESMVNIQKIFNFLYNTALKQNNKGMANCNITFMSKLLKLNKKTVSKYLKLLEKRNILTIFKNRSTHLYKEKTFFTNTSMMLFYDFENLKKQIMNTKLPDTYQPDIENSFLSPAINITSQENIIYTHEIVKEKNKTNDSIVLEFIEKIKTHDLMYNTMKLDQIIKVRPVKDMISKLCAENPSKWETDSEIMKLLENEPKDEINVSNNQI